MGSTIAAHLANVGIPSFLLDIVPPELTEAERKKKVDLGKPRGEKSVSISGKKRAEELSPRPSIERGC